MRLKILINMRKTKCRLIFTPNSILSIYLSLTLCLSNRFVFLIEINEDIVKSSFQRKKNIFLLFRCILL